MVEQEYGRATVPATAIELVIGDWGRHVKVAVLRLGVVKEMVVQRWEKIDMP